MAKNKKGGNFNHFRRKCIFAIRRPNTTNDARYRKRYASDTKWPYIINAEHCIDAHRLAIPSLRSLHHYGVLIHAKA